MHLDKNRKIYFAEIQPALYLFKGNTSGELKGKISGYLFLTLTNDNSKEFTRTQINRANMARELHQRLGCPGQKRLLWSIKNHKIQGCTINTENIIRIIHLYEPDVADCGE